MVYRLIRKFYHAFSGMVGYKWYAQAVTTGRSTLDDMADAISRSTTVTKVDVKAVLIALKEEIYERLRKGEIVDLEELGAFHLTIENLGGSDTKESWKPSLIYRAVIRWISNKKMRRIAEGVEFHQWVNLEEQNLLHAATQAKEAVTNAEHAVQVAQYAVDTLEKEVQLLPDDQLKPVLLMAARAQLEAAESTVAAARTAYDEKTSVVKEYEAAVKRKIGEPHDDELTDVHLPEEGEENEI